VPYGHAPNCWCQECFDAECARSDRALRWTLRCGFGLLAVLVLATLLAGCVYGPSRPNPPESPSNRPPTGQALHVQVSDADGPPIAGAVVTILDNQNAGRTGTTDARGQVFLEQLTTPSEFTLAATADGYVTGTVPVRLVSPTGGATSGNVTIQLAKAPPPTPPRPKVLDGRLVVRGRQMTYPDGRVFVWRGATGFQLLDHLADGRDAEAVLFAAWLRGTGFSLVRVLAQADGMFKLSPEAGRAALSRLCALATEYDVYVELVALADSAALQRDAGELRAQVRAVGQAAAACPAFLVQVANEHEHSTQHGLLHDPVFLASLAAEIPAEVTYTLAPPFDDEALTPTGEYVTRHRDRGRDKWNQVRRVREFEMVSATTGKFTVDDEPIGFDEVARPGARETDCAIAFTQGALARLFEVGSTFHFQDGLFATVPRPNQRACAEAFLEGTRVVADDVRLAYKNLGFHDGPIASAKDGTFVRLYSGLGATSITVGLGLTGADPEIRWQNGWTPRRVLAERPGVTVWEIAQ
jgi:hypothetical protein